MSVSLFAQAFVTTLVVMDPLGNVPVFLSLTAEYTDRARRRVSWQATAGAAAVVFSFALFGQELLALLGISVSALEVAGGLVLALVALQLIATSSGVAESGEGTNVALVPLGTPLLAGPGAIAATMVYIRRAENLGEFFSVLLALAATLVLVYLALRFAPSLGHAIGRNGIQMLSKVVGLLLAAIAVQMVAMGVQYWVLHGV